jgi:hypothetical protein
MREKETRYQDDNAAFAVMVRVGKVTAVDNGKRLARVYFQDLALPSDWLPVVINRDFIPGYDGTQRTEFESGGSGAAAYERHAHSLNIQPWMPKVNDQVLCLYEPIRDGRGFVLGGIQTWQ